MRVFAMRSALVVNSTDAYQAACLAWLGFIQAPVRGTRRLVEAGLLVEVLPAYAPPPMPVSLLYPHRRHVPRGCRRCCSGWRRWWRRIWLRRRR